MSGKLYLVATPIGNLEDITIRASKTLQEVDLIAAEDTRHTLKLLNHLCITKPLISYHRHNEEIKTEYLIEKLEQGENIALVSDAGTPVISDPGGEIVKQAIKREIEIIPIPGPCAAISALIASGIDAKEFCFIGFLPTNKKLRENKFKQLKQETKTIIFYEAPHKLLATLRDLKEYVGNRNIVLAKEITKIHEQYIRGTVDDILIKVKEPKGEYVVVIEGKEEDLEQEEKVLNMLTIEEHYKVYEEQGYDKKEIIKKIAKDRGVNKNEIYIQFIKKD